MSEPPTAGQGAPDAISEPVVSTTTPATASGTSLHLWERLKHHKVMQWTLAYAAAAYTLLHGVEMLSDAQDWPHIIVRVFSIVLMLGIPLVVTLAWYHGAKGLQKVSGPEHAMLTVLLFMAGTILWAVSRNGGEGTPAGAAAPTAAPPAASVPAAPRTAVAVLPFVNLTGDDKKGYLGEGMAEELINTLTKVTGLRVPSRTSSFSYQGRNVDLKQIARDLNVGTILEGSVRAADKRIRITAQLIDAQTDAHLCSETYDEEFTNLFKLQDKLATEISRALQPNLNAGMVAAVAQAPPTQDVEAYNLYLQGVSLMQRTSAQNEARAIEYFQQAISRDPKFARAYAMIGEAQMGWGNLVQQFEHKSAGELAARQALALDPNLANAHNVLAGIGNSRGQPLEMEAHGRAAVSLAANDGFTRTVRALNLVNTGHLSQVLEEGKGLTHWRRPIHSWSPTWRILKRCLATMKTR